MKLRNAFMAGTLALVGVEAGAQPVNNPVYRRAPVLNQTPFGGRDRDCRSTGRDEQAIYDAGREYVEERKQEYLSQRPDLYEALDHHFGNSAPYRVDSVQNRIGEITHPRTYIHGEAGRIMDDLGFTVGNSRAVAQSEVRAEKIRAPDVMKALIAEYNVEIARSNLDPDAEQQYSQEADDVYLKLGNGLDRNIARNNCQGRDLIDRAGSRWFQKNITRGRTNILGIGRGFHF